MNRAHSKGHFYLRDFFNGSGWIPLIIRMPYCILIVFLNLKISNVQRFKVVVEVEAGIRFALLEL